MGRIVIAYQAPGQKPMALTALKDGAMVDAVIRAALSQAEDRALTDHDPVSRRLHGLELQRLRSVFSTINSVADGPLIQQRIQ
jgi:hypothetical protein